MPFEVDGTSWKSYHISWNLPSGESIDDLLRRHSVPNFLQHLSDPDLAIQVVEHRGIYNFGAGIQECTHTSIHNAIGHDRHLIELDAAMTCDGVFIACHDFTPWRVAQVENKFVREFHSTELVGLPVIIREIEDGEVSENNFVVTNDTIQTIEEILASALAANPYVTFFVDVREDELPYFVRWISYHPEYSQNVVVNFYTFNYRDPETIVQEIEVLAPRSDWMENVALMPVIFGEELSALALHQGRRAPYDEDALFTAGETWIDAVARKGLRLVAVNTIYTSISYEMLGENSPSAAWNAFRANQAAERLGEYIRSDDGYLKSLYPHLKLVNNTRTYDYASNVRGRLKFFNFGFGDGLGNEWENHEQKYIRRGRATPGNKKCDIIISDRSEDDISYLAWEAYGFAHQVNFRTPHLETA
ncbi:glycerophosphodiester phosphodiesterase family protein [Agrobacterium larrymoorei]|uniref:GP-PDE domain-containing protein n=1 Tax=Agrobacterium larrymoorei TaxID=160699 RepID=A0ABX8TAK3_9HYPH|nr:glycerophosphodiester phosphodiesterase family protein [Agrobacterium larrymoorei]QYA10289.1 hypothetical protein J5285_22165 [Agrobacterium larrymoorei]